MKIEPGGENVFRRRSRPRREETEKKIEIFSVSTLTVNYAVKLPLRCRKCQGLIESK